MREKGFLDGETILWLGLDMVRNEKTNRVLLTLID